MQQRIQILFRILSNLDNANKYLKNQNFRT